MARRQRRGRRPARALPGAGRRARPRPRSWPTRTGTDPRYVEEWLRGQAAGGYVDYDPRPATYSMTEEQAFALTDPDGPLYLPGAFELAAGLAARRCRRSPRRSAPAPGSAGTSTTRRCSPGASGSSGPATWRNLTAAWLPALDGVVEQAARRRPGGRHRLRARRVHGADGPGVTRRRPFVGSDYHEGSIDAARKRAAEAGVGERVGFEVATARRPSPARPSTW